MLFCVNHTHSSEKRVRMIKRRVLQAVLSCRAIPALLPATPEFCKYNPQAYELEELIEVRCVRSLWTEMLADRISQQLGHPTRSLIGWLVNKFLTGNNQVLELSAVRLCGIQPDDTVLELGFGPGLGVEAAAPLLSGPKGKLIGVDYSEYMHKVASKRVEGLIASGKVSLHHARVEAMPLPDCSVDRVFHCNCYYFWPDLRAGTAEIHRVMKPGGLMVTTLRVRALAYLTSKNILQGKNWNPEAYMDALSATGFTDIRMEDRKDKGITFQAIFATACK
ncbi:hypothetical protein GJAV_G00192170 [Gymnothorax javanicus]|nr:hypothetical protein GJAV_G00192170 [Gymnothorax javanicus]